MVQTAWVWFGNAAQINANPNTAPTNAQASQLNGRSASGTYDPGPPRAGLQTVELFGTPVQPPTQPGNPATYVTGYNQSLPPSLFSYTPPGATTGVTGSRIVGAFGTRLEVTAQDGTVTAASGQIMQMSNGDLFFRPTLGVINQGTLPNDVLAVAFTNTTPVPAGSTLFVTPYRPTIVNPLEPPCFTAGTMILTDRGECRVEDLRIGDRVMTRDHGAQPLRWVGRRSFGAAALERAPHLCPIRIAAGALAPGLPRTDLIVSPQHRVLVRSAIARRMFGADEVLVAAKQLLELDGIEIVRDGQGADYIHLMCDSHEVIRANGADTETLFAGPRALLSVGPAARAEILEIFPDLADEATDPAPARLLAQGRMARRLASRHHQNGKQLVH